jgi:phage tail tape-measure protein
MSGEFLMGVPRFWRVANPLVAAVVADFEYALTHAEAGDSDAVRLVDEVAPTPGWTTKRLHRRTPKTPRRPKEPPMTAGGAV